jgi:hypothetical protein
MPKKKDIVMAKGERTTLTRANAKSYSLRTTVPKGIANQFELKEKDSLYWEIRADPEGRGLIIVVTPNLENGRKKKK